MSVFLLSLLLLLILILRFVRKDGKFVLSKYKIKKILKSKGKGNNKQYFVKWLHWLKKFNSWISARDVNNL
jgi:hypothetical protein